MMNTDLSQGAHNSKGSDQKGLKFARDKMVCVSPRNNNGEKMKTETKSYKPKSKNQEHLTPDIVYEMIETKWGISKDKLYDPCPPGTPYKAPCFFNGLYGDWQEYNYLNSPFNVKDLTNFARKADEQAMKGKTTFMLCPPKIDQEWFHEVVKPRITEVLWIRGRLKYKNNKDNATDGHFLVRI